MTFKVLSLVVEPFWGICYISYCNNPWSANMAFLHRCVTNLSRSAKIGILDLSLIKLLQNEQGSIVGLTV